MWEAVAQFAIKRILLTDFTMWLAFLLFGYLAMPADIALWLNQKTPAYFPDWFGISDLAILFFSLACLSVTHYFTRLVKWLWALRQKTVKNTAENAQYQQAIIQLKRRLSQLSAEEYQVVNAIMANRFAPTMLMTTNAFVLNKLEIDGVISNVAQYRLLPLYTFSSLVVDIFSNRA